MDLAAVRTHNGLVSWHDADDFEPLLANGAAVTTWTPRVGSAVANGGTSPTYRTAGNSATGNRAVRYTAASSQYLDVDGLAPLASGGGTFTACAIFQRRSTGEHEVIGFGNSAGNTALQVTISQTLTSVSGAALWDNGPGGTGVHPTSGWPPTRDDERTIAIWVRKNNGASATYTNGRPTSFTLANNTDTYALAKFGCVPFGGGRVNHGNYDAERYLAWDHALTAADAAAVTLHLGAAPLIRFQLFILGDSMAEGAATSGHSAINSLVSDAWIAAHAYALGDTCTYGGQVFGCTTAGDSAAADGPLGVGGTAVFEVLSYALPTIGVGLAPGYTARELINQAVAERAVSNSVGAPSSQLDELQGDLLDHKDESMVQVVLAWIGQNDMRYGATAAQVLASYWQLLDEIRTEMPWALIVAVTPTPASDITDEWADYCQLVRDEYTSHADWLWDLGAHPALQDYTDPVLYNGADHLSRIGQNEALTTLPIRAIWEAAQRKQLGHQMRT